MEYNDIRFQHFTSLKGYCKLQMLFLAFDYSYPQNRRNIISPIKELKIQTLGRFEYEDDPDIHSEYIVEKDFIEDFAIPSAKRLAYDYYNYLRKLAFERGILTEESRLTFAKHYLTKINQFEQALSNANFIEENLHLILEEQIEILKDNISELITNPYPEIKTKLQFNLIRTEVEYFFHALRENKIISYMSDADLVRFIDNTCERLEKKGSKKYKGISGTKTKLNDFKNLAGRPQTPSSITLAKKFNKDFFNI